LLKIQKGVAFNLIRNLIGMYRKWQWWWWLAIVSILFGILLATFQPTLNGSGNVSDFGWRFIMLRFFSFAPLCFFAFALLVFLLKFAGIIFRRLFTWCALKWLLRAGAALMILIALFYLEENWRGKHAWGNYKHEWEAKGEKFDFASFIPPPVPDDQNFALTPIVASGYSRVLDKNGNRIRPENTNVVNRLTMNMYRTGLLTSTNLLFGNWQKGRLTDLKAWQNYYRTMFLTNDTMSEPPPMPGMPMPEHFDTNIYRNVVVALDTNEFPIAAQQQTPAADVLLALSKYDSVIEDLRQASRLPFSRFPLNYTADDPAQITFPHWGALKSSAWVLRLRAVAELDNGQADKALADVRLTFYLAGSIHNEPSDYSFEEQMSLVGFAVQIIWEGLARRQWSGEQLVALEQELAGIDAVQDYGFALRAGRASNLKTIDYLRRGRTTNSITCMCGDIMWLPTLAYRFSPSGWFDLNKRATATVFEDALPTPAEAEQRILSPEISGRFGRAERLARRPHLIPDSIWLSFVPSLDRRAMHSTQMQAGVDMARIACALERYWQAKSVYPETLDELAPQFIKKIPHDIINGQPLHYRRTDDGKFLLYSVGWDGRDDDGLPEDFKPFFQLKPAGDWVWRYPPK
jgi:hypothetical protein